MYTVDFDDQYEVIWDQCDLVVETTVAFYIDTVEDWGNNWKSLEVVIEDRLCDEVETEGFAMFSRMNYRYTETMDED